MGYVKSRIRELTKEAGSKTKARSEAESWFNSSKRSIRENEAQQTRDRFEPGKIYVFGYSPKYDYEWWDQNPVVLALERVGDNDLGVNLNLLPIRLKEQLLDDLNASAQRPLRITYQGMKSYLKAYGYDFAIRQYIPSRKRSQTVVSYLRWPEIALCDFIALNGKTVRQVRLLFSRR